MQWVTRRVIGLFELLVCFWLLHRLCF